MDTSDSKATSPSLLVGVGLGNSNAWERLVACYQPTIMAWCRRKGLDESSAMDVVQDTLLSVSRSLPKFRSTPGSGAFRAWLWRITQYRILDYRRKQNRQLQGIGGSSFAEKIARIVDPNLDDDLNESTIAPCHTTELDRLSQSYQPHTWQAFLRTVVDGKTTAEVAEEFQMTPVAVRQLRSRILRRLRTSEK